MIASSFFASLLLVLDLLSTITSMAVVQNNPKHQDQLTVGRIRERLIAMENELEALEHQKYQTQQYNQQTNVYHPSSSNDIEREENIPRKIKDLSSTDLHSLEEVLNDQIPLRKVNYVGNKIDNDGLEEVNPLERGSTPSDVEFINPTSVPVKPNNRYSPDNLQYRPSSPVETMGRFYEQPIVDKDLGGHIVNGHGVVNQPNRSIHNNKQKGFGQFSKDVLEDVENNLILALQVAKQHGLNSQDIVKDLEAKQAGKKDAEKPKDQ